MKRMIANIKDSPTGVKVPGDLIVDGTITQNKYELDQDITFNMNSNAQGVLTPYYAHARVSNGKLSIVLAFSMPYNETEQKTIPAFTTLGVGNISLPDSILSSLYPSPTDWLDIKSVSGSGSGYGLGKNLTVALSKEANGISIGMQAPESIVQGSGPYSSLIWRFEFNFLLS